MLGHIHFERLSGNAVSGVIRERLATAGIDPTGLSSAKELATPAARTARERIRIASGGYRRDHLRALAQRVEVAIREARIIGSKSNLLQTRRRGRRKAGYARRW